MQKIGLIIFLTIQAFHLNAQIDSLETEEEVKAFNKTLPSQYRIQLKKITDLTEVDNYGEPFDKELCQTMAEQLGINDSFQKGDFDGNGLTDILLLGRSHGIGALIVLTMDNGEYTYHGLGNMNQEGCIYPLFKYQGNQPLIELTYQKKLSYRERYMKKHDPEAFYKIHTDELITQKLIFLNGELIEYNPTPIKHNIEKIEYSSGGCYGSCPIFKLTLHNSRKAQLNAINFNRKFNSQSQLSIEMKGLYHTYLKPETYQNLINQINYLDFPFLEDGYDIQATDMPASKLIITYNKGLVKSINDYGMQGTRGLSYLYDSFAKLRFSETWELLPKSADNAVELDQ